MSTSQVPGRMHERADADAKLPENDNIDSSFDKGLSVEWNGEKYLVFDSNATEEEKTLDNLPKQFVTSKRVGEEEMSTGLRTDWLREQTREESFPSIDTIQSWDFDVLKYSETVLVSVVEQMFMHYNLLVIFDIDSKTMNAFIRAVLKNHDNHEYHNCYHAVSTAHCSFLLLSLAGGDEFLEEREIFAVLFGALVHDVDHKGNNNDFEVKTKSSLALKYNDNSVLERHSAEVAFDMVAKPELNIFKNMSVQAVDYIRNFAIEVILATDPAKHTELTKTMAGISERSSLHPDGSIELFNVDDADFRLLLGQIIVHAADISIPVHQNFTVARDWCIRISLEFKRQAENEKKLGLTVAPFMNGLETEYEISKKQVCFYNFMVLPVFKMISIFLPKAAHLEQSCLENTERYREVVNSAVHHRK